MKISQYDLVLVNLDPTMGSEKKKTRPCAVLSPDEMNDHLRTIVIAPVAHTSKDYPTRVAIHQGNTKGWVVIDQIRTIDQRRVIKPLGKLSHSEMERVKNVIRETFVA